MKTSILKKANFLFFLIFFLLVSCKKDKQTTPSLTTTDITEISYTTATSGGNIKNDGGATVLSRGICWNTSPDPKVDNNKTSESNGDLGIFTSKLTQLSPNTLYYVRAYATNSNGTGYGNQVSFSTNQIAFPALTTTEITSITNSSAVSGGTITADNGGAVSTKGVCWSISENPTISDDKTSDGSGIDNFISTLSGLTSNTKYYVRAYATNSAGTAYGDQLNFTTTPGTPTLSTFSVSSYTANSSNLKGSIVTDGGASVTSRGVCYSISHNPTTADNKTSDGTGTGSYISYIKNLLPNTTYYARPFAVNSSGTQYGNEVSFSTLQMLTDVDGNTYNVASIGTQVWMAENLKTTKYNDGTSIQLNTVNSFWNYTNTSNPGYCWYNNNETTYKNIYGALYNWYAVNTGKLCPLGWHVPTDNEFITLMTFVGGENVGGTKLKESGNAHWAASSTSSNNEFSFTALPGGQRYNGFASLGTFGDFWSTTAYDFQTSYTMELTYNYWGVTRVGYQKSYGMSVRCIKD